MNFVGTTSKVCVLSFVVSPETVSQDTEIPRTGEEWFKATKLKLQKCDEFLKPKHIGVDMTSGIPISFLKENYSKILPVIYKYFTCEGRFHMTYKYHLRIFLHFTGKKILDLPFFLFRSLVKMSDKVQSRPECSETSIFHHVLIKFLVMEELKKLNRDRVTYMFLSGYEVDVLTPKKTPKSKTNPSIKNDEPIAKAKDGQEG